MKANNLDRNTESESLESVDFKLSDLSTRLKIGFDGKRAARNFTGLGNYSRYIIRILASYFPENDYNVYSPGTFNSQIAADIKKLTAVSICHPKSPVFSGFWRSYGILGDLISDGVQIYHGLSNEIPFGIKKTGIVTVVTIHDLIFLRYPHYYSWFDTKMYDFKFRYACRNADQIIAISEQTKRDIIQYYQIPEARIEVIYQNCNPIFRAEISGEEQENIKESYSLPDKYLLSVGTIEARKNLMLIVRALINVNSDIHLVVIGRETSYARKVRRFISENNLDHRVHFLKNVPLEDLPAIYRQAEIFLFPSQFEGFGIPIVEALHSRIPVIAAAGSCLEEAGGSGSIYIRPDDEKGCAVAINSVLNDPGKKQEMVDAGIEYVRKFSDVLIARKLMRLYNNLYDNA
jgi:glycosyltransferase involved in cell wall biosynthesis